MMEEKKTPKKRGRKKGSKKCTECKRITNKPDSRGLCSHCRDIIKKKKEKKKLILSKEKQKDENKLRALISDLVSLSTQPCWAAYEEAMHIIRQDYASELVSSEFRELSPTEKDLRHRVILEVLTFSEKMMTLPKVLEKHLPSNWFKFEEMRNEHFRNKGGI